MKTCPFSSDDVVTCQEGGANCVCEGEGSGRQCFCDRGYNVTSSDPGVCVGKTIAWMLDGAYCHGHTHMEPVATPT